MIHARFDHDEESLSLDVDGHAGFAEYGTDIVCAGVSALGQSLLFALERRGLCIAYGIGPGGLHVTAQRTEDSWPMFEMCRVGIYMLSEKYPDNVRVGGEIGEKPLLP